MKFKKGDQVRLKCDGELGKIILVDDTGIPYLVRFKIKLGGPNNDRWCTENQIESVCKFKPGDKVRSKEDYYITDIVELVPGMADYDRRSYGDASKGFRLKDSGWEYQEYWALVGKDSEDCDCDSIVKRNKFEVGDEVKYVKRSVGDSSPPNNAIGRVVEIIGDTYVVTFYSWEGGWEHDIKAEKHCWGTSASNLRRYDLAKCNASEFYPESIAYEQTADARARLYKYVSMDFGFTTQTGVAALMREDAEMKTRMLDYKLKPKKGFMQQITDRAKATFDKETQAFIKLGWLDRDLELTSTGREALFDYLFDLHKEELGKLAIKRVKEEESKDK